MKKLLLLSLLAGIFFIRCQSPREKIIATDTLLLDTIKIDTTDITCKDAKNENCPNLHFGYPDFKIKDDSINQYLNNETKQILLSHFDSATTSVSAYIQSFFQLYHQDKLSIHQYDDLPGEYYSTIDITPAYKNKQYYTLVYTSDIFLGGAHPFGSQDYYVYDLSKLKKVVLSDILQTEDENLWKLAEKYFRKELQISDSVSLADAGYFVLGENIEDEDSPDYGKFKLSQNFAITEKGILFLYNHYDIAPYAAGRQSFEIPFTELKPYLKIKL